MPSCLEHFTKLPHRLHPPFTGFIRLSQASSAFHRLHPPFTGFIRLSQAERKNDYLQGESMKRKLNLILDYIHNNLDKKILLKELAQAAEMSPSRVFQLFRAELNITPHQYLKRRRLEKARELLATSLLNVQQIRYAVGYGDDSHFVRDFKDTFGLTPSAYRECITAPVEPSDKA
jgi:transcriptional regulator GlxA family with amidase domain